MKEEEVVVIWRRKRWCGGWRKEEEEAVWCEGERGGTEEERANEERCVNSCTLHHFLAAGGTS